jgi:hypothetical protein
MVVLEDCRNFGMAFKSCFATSILDTFMVVARRIILAIFFSATTSLTVVNHTLGSPATPARLNGCYSVAY